MKRNAPEAKKKSSRAPLNHILNTKLIAYVLGILLYVEGALFLICMGVSLFYHEKDYIYFICATAVNLVLGAVLTSYGKGADSWLTRRDGYCIVTLTWLMFTLLGTMPFYMSREIPSLSDAFFETMSGFTTTGFTVIDHIDTLPKGLAFWRNLTQWVGSLGIVCFTIAFLPIFGGGNLQLFSAEATGVTRDKLHPKISVTTKLIWTVYILLTAGCAALLCVGGMGTFDSICHSLSIMGTGGYSTRQASMAAWDSPFIEYVSTVFMLVSSLNFSLLVLCLQGKFSKLIKDGETHWFLGSVAIITIIITITLFTKCQYPFEVAFRKAAFQVASIHSSCGLLTEYYTLWPLVTWFLLLFTMLAGGCTGATSGGIKNMRIILFYHAVKNQFKRLIHPNAILPVRTNKHVVPQSTLMAVATFTLFYLFCAFVGGMILTMLGVDIFEAMTTSISAIGNMGVSFGCFGPAYTLSSMPDAGLWVISFLMLIGRLELFSVLVLFSPVYWDEW